MPGDPIRLESASNNHYPRMQGQEPIQNIWYNQIHLLREEFEAQRAQVTIDTR